MNINWRNWYLMSAMELEGKFTGDEVQQMALSMRSAFLSPDMLKNFPARIFLQNWITRVDPDKANDVQLTLGFSFPDIGEEWALEVRRGVVQLHQGIPEGTTLKLTLDKTYLDTVMSGENGLLKGALLGDVKVDGDLLDIKTFLGCFDFEEVPIALTVR